MNAIRARRTASIQNPVALGANGPACNEEAVGLRTSRSLDGIRKVFLLRRLHVSSRLRCTQKAEHLWRLEAAEAAPRSLM